MSGLAFRLSPLAGLKWCPGPDSNQASKSSKHPALHAGSDSPDKAASEGNKGLVDQLKVLDQHPAAKSGAV